MKLSNPKSLLVATIGMAICSSVLMLLGYGTMHLASQKNNVFAQGSHYVLRLTSEYGIREIQDLKTDRERSLYKTISWMNDQCATMVKLHYMQGHMFMVSGIGLMIIAMFNGMAWWKWNKDLQNHALQPTPLRGVTER